MQQDLSYHQRIPQAWQAPTLQGQADASWFPPILPLLESPISGPYQVQQNETPTLYTPLHMQAPTAPI